MRVQLWTLRREKESVVLIDICLNWNCKLDVRGVYEAFDNFFVHSDGSTEGGLHFVVHKLKSVKHILCKYHLVCGGSSPIYNFIKICDRPLRENGSVVKQNSLWYMETSKRR